MTNDDQRFAWDEDKRLSNIEKHDIDFGDAVEIFDGRHTVTRKTDDKDEDRFVTTGKLDHRGLDPTGRRQTHHFRQASSQEGNHAPAC